MKGFLITMCFGATFFGAFNGSKIWYEAFTGPYPDLIPLGVALGACCWVVGIAMAFLGVSVYKSG